VLRGRAAERFQAGLALVRGARAHREQRWFRVKRSLACAATCQTVVKADSPKTLFEPYKGTTLKTRFWSDVVEDAARTAFCQRIRLTISWLELYGVQYRAVPVKRKFTTLRLISSPSLSAFRLPGLQNLF
jgi:hypothetical protein